MQFKKYYYVDYNVMTDTTILCESLLVIRKKSHVYLAAYIFFYILCLCGDAGRRGMKLSRVGEEVVLDLACWLRSAGYGHKQRLVDHNHRANYVLITTPPTTRLGCSSCRSRSGT